MLYKKERNFFLKYRETLLTALVMLACLALFTFFPTTGASQKVTSGIVFLGLLPVLYLKFVLKKKLKNFGWQLGDWEVGLIFSGIYLVLALLITYILFHYTSFPKEYVLPASIIHNFWYFLGYELFLVGAFAALYEIFFRGFVMLLLVPRAGFYAIFYQFFLLFLFFWVTDNLTWTNAPLLLTAAFSGLTTFKSQSLLYSFVASLFFLIILDALVIKFVYLSL